MKKIFSILLLVPALLLAGCKSNEPEYNPGQSSNSENGSNNSGSQNQSSDEMSAYFTVELAPPMAVRVTDRSTGKKAVYDMGDGQTYSHELPYGAAIYHSYLETGTYKITARVYNSKGQYKEYSRSVTIEKPKVYVKGIEYVSILEDGKYHKAKLVDDDFFTTTWINTSYTPILYKNILPYSFNFSSPVLLDGLDEDDWYKLYIYYNTKSSGTGTACLEQKIQTSIIRTYLPYIEVAQGSVKVRLLMDYK